MMSESPEIPDLEVDIPIPAGLKVTTDRPYRILVVSDFAGSPDGSVRGGLDSRVIALSADNFDQVMAEASPELSYQTADPLAGGTMVEVNLRFDSLRRFAPEEIGRQIPAVRSLLDAREKLVGRLLGKLSPSALTDALRGAVAADAGLAWLADAVAWTPSAAPEASDVVDDLLGQFNLGGEKTDDTTPAPPPKSKIGKMVSAAAATGGALPAEEASALRRAIGEIDRRVSVWLTAVLHAPQVQAIETAWRSLQHLVRQIDFRRGIKLSILHARPAELIDRFTTLLIDPVFDEGADAPDVIVIDDLFGNTASDVATLEALAQNGASLPAVVLAGASPAFFGVKHAWQIPTLPPLMNMFDQWQFAKWKSLRDQPYARSLGVVLGRCLLRAPHGRRDEKDLEFAYRENCISARDLIWLRGPMAAACTVARAVADTGWPTAMAGHVHGRLEGFPTATGGKKGDTTFGPGDCQLKQEKIEELAVVGVNVVTGRRNHADVEVLNALTAARPQRFDPAGLLEVSLPYQLFAGRLAVLLFDLKPHLSGMSAERVVPFVKQHVRDWLSFDKEPAAEQLSVQTRPSEDNPKVLELAVTVTPPAKVLPAGIPVVLGYRLD